MSLLNTLLRELRDAIAPPSSRTQRPSGQKRTTPSPKPAPAATDYPGDFTGVPVLRYAPNNDRAADPGEVVWTWVPFEEDHSQGKDRPVLVIGNDGPWLLALPLTSQDHDRDAGQEAAEGRYWVDIGTGLWDKEGRASEVRVNRILRVDQQRVRRTAGRLGKRRFDEVAAAVVEHAG